MIHLISESRVKEVKIHEEDLMQRFQLDQLNQKLRNDN